MNVPLKLEGRAHEAYPQPDHRGLGVPCRRAAHRRLRGRRTRVRRHRGSRRHRGRHGAGDHQRRPHPDPADRHPHQPVADRRLPRYVNWYVQSQTSTTFQALVSFRNPTSGTIAPPWTLSWSFANGQMITGILGGATSYSQTGSRVTVSGTETVAGGQSHSFIVTGTWNGYTNATPTGFC
ncbi:cellulose binding domain-containing protein [Luedemannella flava]